MTKYTKNDYFAAASAQDLWAFDGRYGDLDSNDVCNLCGIGYPSPYNDLYDEANKLNDDEDTECEDIAYLAAQIGCEKAGL